jgi:ribosome-binding factor A
MTNDKWILPSFVIDVAEQRGHGAAAGEQSFVMKKSATPNRAFKVADQIQRDLTELIARELKDPRVGMVTIQAVEVTPDYAHAKIFFSVLVGDPAECEEALNQAAGFLRNGLFKRLHIHTVPTLHFQFDRTTERAADMNALIAKAVSSRAKED